MYGIRKVHLPLSQQPTNILYPELDLSSPLLPIPLPEVTF